jgi:hypothetical protein
MVIGIERLSKNLGRRTLRKRGQKEREKEIKRERERD